MELSLSHLSLLIELTDKEIKHLKKIIDDPSSLDNEVDDSGELTMQYIALSSALAEQYKTKWTSNSEHPSYEDLVNELHSAK